MVDAPTCFALLQVFACLLQAIPLTLRSTAQPLPGQLSLLTLAPPARQKQVSPLNQPVLFRRPPLVCAAAQTELKLRSKLWFRFKKIRRSPS